MKGMKHKKVRRNEWKTMKDNKVNEKKKGKTENQRYEREIERILRWLQRIEMKHVKWKWNHRNHIKNHENIAVDPKMENRNYNTDKENGIKI